VNLFWAGAWAVCSLATVLSMVTGRVTGLIGVALLGAQCACIALNLQVADLKRRLDGK
jgi:hypothetical protein